MSALNVTQATFKNGSKSAITEKIFQWSYGQKYEIVGLELPSVFRVDFSNTPSIGDSKPQTGMDNVVDIPDEYLLSGEPVYAFIVLHEGEDDGRTIYTIKTSVPKRPRPSEVQPTPVQQDAIDQAIAAFTVIEGRAELAVQHYPYISENDTWVIWNVNAEEFVDTGVKATGPQGDPGNPGKKGDPGEDGVSPIITVQDIEGGHRIIIEGAFDTKTFDIIDGKNGNDGISPLVSIQNITGGHRVIITDKVTTYVFDVIDGQDYVLTQQDKEDIAALVDLSNYATKTELNNKVDKVNGKGLSTNDYTAEEKNKLSGIETGAEKNIQSDWNQTDASKDDYIKNKPEIPPAVTVDDELSDESENPVQNKVITEELNDVKADLSELSSSIAPVESSATATAAHAVGELFMMGETLMVALSAIAIGDTITTEGGSPNAAVTKLTDKLIKDVQVNGTSVVNQGVANVPKGGNGTLGALSTDGNYGVEANANGRLYVTKAALGAIKSGSNNYNSIVPSTQHQAVFYGLAKAAEDSTQGNSENPVGTYTDAAKKAIREMLGIPNMDSELITEVTVTEDSASVVIDTDSNGQPFALRIAKIQLITAASTTGVADNVAAAYKARLTDDTLGDWYDMPTLKMNTAPKSLMTYEFESYNGLFFLRASAAREYGASSNGMTTMYINRMIKALEQIKFSQYSSKTSLIPAGSIIRVFGVRV